MPMSYLESGVYYGDTAEAAKRLEGTKSLEGQGQQNSGKSAIIAIQHNRSSPMLSRQDALKDPCKQKPAPMQASSELLAANLPPSPSPLPPKSPRSPRLNRMWHVFVSRSSEASLASEPGASPRRPNSAALGVQPPAFSLGSPSSFGESLDVPGSTPQRSVSTSSRASGDEPLACASCTKSVECVTLAASEDSPRQLRSPSVLTRSKSVESLDNGHQDSLISRKISQPAGVVNRANFQTSASADSPKKKRSIMRNANPFTKFGMLSRKHGAERAGSSRDDLQRWAESFEHLLHSKEGVSLFRLFLQREFSDENIEFWLACEEYKKLRGPKMQLKAQEICHNFVAIQSPKEVNLDQKTRELAIEGAKNPTKETFDMAQARIVALMEKDSYPRFLKSDVYLNLLKKS